MRHPEWLAKPLRLVLLVTTFIALPLLALGEFVAVDTRSRLESVERESTDATATRAAELVGSRLASLGDEVFGIARSQELRVACASLDPTSAQRLIGTFESALSSDIERAFVFDRDSVLARIPAGETEPPSADYLVSGGRIVTGARAIRLVTHGTVPPGVILSTPLGTGCLQSFVAEVPLARIALWLTPFLSGAREVHLLDERDRVIASADAAGTSNPMRQLSDPLLIATATSDFVSVVPVPGVIWRTVAVRQPTALLAFESAAGEQRILRLALLGLLLLAAYVTGSVAAQLRRDRQELRVANARLDAASEAKSRFLAAVSHDLRTPLNAILGFSDVLLQKAVGDLNEKQDEYLRDIHAAGQHQLTLVNDLLDLSKIEAGRMELHPVPFSMREIVDGAVTVVRPMADAKGVRLETTTPIEAGTVEHDPARLKQVLLNLLSNAVKFTPTGGCVRTEVTLADDWVVVAVSDTGVGIHPADQAVIFEEFRQVGASARSAEGTGLGLALVRGFVRMMGGEVALRSVVGEGSTFTVKLPRRQPPPPVG